MANAQFGCIETAFTSMFGCSPSHSLTISSISCGLILIKMILHFTRMFTVFLVIFVKLEIAFVNSILCISSFK